MKNIPKIIDGAKVIKLTLSENIPLGIIKSNDNSSEIKIFSIVICKYPESTKFCRFSCDKNWNVIQDSEHNSIEEAEKQLPEQYKKLELNWIEI